MPALTDLEARVSADHGWQQNYSNNIGKCVSCAEGVYLVHVFAVKGTAAGGRNTFIDLLTQAPHQLPTSDRLDFRDNTRATEDAFDLGRSLYFYGGRALPAIGGVAMAFASPCENGHTGSATPFDTGGMFNGKISIEASQDTPDGRRNFVRNSIIELSEWRSSFARYLAAYFTTPADYWRGVPSRRDSDDVFGHSLNEWRSWAFEVRFLEGHNICDRTAWCASPNLYQSLLNAVEDMPVNDSETELMRFLDDAEELIPGGSDEYITLMEKWVQRQIDV